MLADHYITEVRPRRDVNKFLSVEVYVLRYTTAYISCICRLQVQRVRPACCSCEVCNFLTIETYTCSWDRDLIKSCRVPIEVVVDVSLARGICCKSRGCKISYFIIVERNIGGWCVYAIQSRSC